MTQSLIKLIYAPDGETIARKIRDYFSGMVDVSIEAHHTPLTEEIDLAVFILTTQSVQDTGIQEILKQCAIRRLQILPVVEELDRYDFTLLPPDLDMISIRNTLGWKSSDPDTDNGTKVLITINRWIGRKLFERERQLFISYRRKDGEEIAGQVYNYFTGKGYIVFKDTEKIPGGFKVQRYIRRAIFERDFLLLIDSPDAKNSKWIQEEIEIAIHNRIKILVLRLPDGGIPIPKEVRVIDITETVPLDDVEKILKEEISRIMHFDLKVEDALDELVNNFGFKLKQDGTRRVLLTNLTNPDAPDNTLLEFESSPHSLESLYRLNCGYEEHKETGLPISSAFFVQCASLSEYQRKAVHWARNSSPLDVLTLDEFMAEILD